MEDRGADAGAGHSPGESAADDLLVILGYVLLIISAALTLWSMVHYLLAAWPHLSTTPKEK